MVFSSIPFLFYFLPATLALYFVVPRSFKNLVLFLASLFFYAWGEPFYVLIMIFSTIVDYTHGILIEKFITTKKTSKAKLVLFSSIVINLGLLCFFKYADFFITNFNSISGTNIALLNLPLPIGISFYTFQTMSYSIDVYRQQVKAQKNIISFGAYVALFPQLIAGPIVRFKTIAQELDARVETTQGFAQGALRFTMGLGKKVLLANNIGMLADFVTQSNAQNLPIITAWLGIIAFAFQIYFDFSGYSDMAIGLGKMLGFTFDENFNYPYTSKTITDFWRRWHISLGTWFKEYVYIPLGGNKKGNTRTIINICIVWFLTGFWHGASWNFILWGIYFGAILIAEKLFLGRLLENTPNAIKHFYALFLILIGWVIFAFDSTAMLFAYFNALFGNTTGGLANQETMYLLATNLVLLIILVVGSTPFPKNLALACLGKIKSPAMQGIAESLVMVFVLLLCVAYIINSSYNPFLYFRF